MSTHHTYIDLMLGLLEIPASNSLRKYELVRASGTRLRVQNFLTVIVTTKKDYLLSTTEDTSE